MKMAGGGATLSCMLLILYVEGIVAGDWTVQLPTSPVCAVVGSSVVLPCSYDYPQSSNPTKEAGELPAQDEKGEVQEYKVVSEMWCLGNSRCVTPRYVFHSARILLDPSYKNRVEYLGQLGSKNCSLRISDVRQSDSGTYVFYLITNHTMQKMPEQSGIQLLVAASSSAVTASAGPSKDIAEGGVLYLACCSPEAGPQARYTWYTSTRTGPRHIGQVWNITEVTSEDSSSYYCQIQTGDQVQNSSIISIDVEYSPRNTTVSVAPLGELQDKLPVTLTCSSDANPSVHTYSWFKGVACLTSADKSFYPARRSPAVPTGRGRTLSVTNISAEEYGQHCCVARNRHGSQANGVTLRSSRTVNPSHSSESRLVPIGVILCFLLAIIVIVAFFIRRKCKSSTQRSYILTGANATTH